MTYEQTKNLPVSYKNTPSSHFLIRSSVLLPPQYLHRFPIPSPLIILLDHSRKHSASSLRRFKQRHAGQQLQVIRAAEHAVRIIRIQFQQSPADLPQVSSQVGVVQKIFCFLEILDRIICRHAAESQPVDLREDIPHPVTLFASVFDLRQSGVKVPSLCLLKPLQITHGSQLLISLLFYSPLL